MWRKQTIKLLQMVVVLVLALQTPVIAQTSSSSNYQVNEYQFGSGGELENSSTNFKAQTSLG